MENTNIEKQCNAAVPVAERVKQIIFLILAAAFFFVPWIYAPLRNHAPGIAVICGVVFAIAWGNPFEKQTAKLTSPLLGAAIVGMGFGMNREQQKRIDAIKAKYKSVEDMNYGV